MTTTHYTALDLDFDLDLDSEHVCQSDHTNVAGESTGTCRKSVTHRWRATHATGRTLNICLAAAEYAAACMKLPYRVCVCSRPVSECWNLYPI